MGAAAGPDIIEDGLVLCLDAGNRASYSVTNILTYWTEYAGRAVHYEVLNAYSVKLKNTFNSWVGYYPATITSTGRYTITFTYYSDTNGSSLYLDNDGVMDNIYNNYTLTANIASQTYTASVDINTTGAINFYFMRFSGGNIFITDVNFYKSDTIWTDLAGSNNGTLTNGPTFSSANGGSIVFDGVDDFAEITNNNSLSFGSGEFTIEVFFKPKVSQTGGNFPAIINKSIGDFTNPTGTGGVTGWILFWYSNQYEFRLGDSSTTFNSIIFPSLVTNDDTWRYLAVTIPADSSLIKGYYNGNMVITGTKTLTNDTNTNVSLTINSWRQFGRRLNSQTASVKLYNRALTPAEVLQNYNATKGRFLL
jgi:hypothetical protein